MSYNVELTRSAQRQLIRLPVSIRQRVTVVLVALENQPRPRGSIKLRGGDDEYRARVGDYRILYEVDDKLRNVRVSRIAHRNSVYKR